ncbi:hypothetical protein HYH03_003066 [Edaphochlamys debaryana]|uniref:RanBP2-type domain-containing protein n=1 Tax=Edaphochlamys debaryana TaxID=47281 RepID=A0A835YJL6_9CHLO|nr:hypothetical protein HYH03_003066 [Edaphochlamys debaryana]|eukprot:KAG2498874.1 hypothetical protein HYH03_003066 [Edaphochlamys debaryana]
MVLQDKGCVFCRQENPAVFFTRFMGDYTARLGPEDFDKIQARADRRELFHLPEINGYFDNEKHYQDIKALCGFTHPILETDGAKRPPKFNNFTALKRHVESTHNQFFCDVCVKGRKVFVPEQMLYSKEALRRHQDTGDESGPLAESGFKGHPLCRFCRIRFYDPNELYRHMESAHEHCFLCRRANPTQYIYFHHYKELEDHFTKKHHPCPHPACLERKFVVFDSDYELRAHFAAEHGDEVKMTGAQRRQAMTIPLNFQYRSHDDEETEPGPSARLERAAVVIGGGHNLPTRGRGRAQPQQSGGFGGRAPGGMHHSRSEPQIAPQEAVPELESVTFTAEDFPAPSSSNAGGAGALGRWAAFAGSQGTGGSLSSEQDFPALPSLSQKQRRRIREQQQSLATRLSAAAQPPRVINRAGAPGPSGGAGPSGSGGFAAAAEPLAAQSVPGAADFPALAAAPRAAPAASSSSAARREPPPAPAAPAPAPSTSSAPSSAAATAAFFGAPSRAADLVAPASAPKRAPGMGHEEFPTLGGGAGGGGGGSKAKASAKAPPASPPPASAAYSGVASGASPGPSATAGLTQRDVISNLFMRPGSAAAPSAAAAAAPPASSASEVDLKVEDFPSLPPGTKPAGKAKGKAALKAAPPAKAASSSSSVPAAPAASISASTSSGGGGGGGVSDSLKAANRALVEQIKRQLTGSAVDTFRQQSMLFMRGELPAEEFHDYMVSLGLLSLVAQLVSLCPDAAKRRTLLDVHKGFIASPAAQDPSLVGAGWMPPEAAYAKANRVATHSAWACTRCALINAPDDARCESCSAHRPSEEQQLAASNAAILAPSPAAFAALAARQPAAPPPPIVPFVTPKSAAAAAAPPPPQAPPAESDFPTLVGTGRGPRAPPPPPSAAFSAITEQEAADAAFAAQLAAEEEAGAGGSMGKGKKGKKGTTFTIGLPQQAAGSSGSGGRTNPQNVWTQPQFKAKVGNQWSGQGAGKVAKMHGAVNDAWS